MDFFRFDSHDEVPQWEKKNQETARKLVVSGGGELGHWEGTKKRKTNLRPEGRRRNEVVVRDRGVGGGCPRAGRREGRGNQISIASGRNGMRSEKATLTPGSKKKAGEESILRELYRIGSCGPRMERERARGHLATDDKVKKKKERGCPVQSGRQENSRSCQ